MPNEIPKYIKTCRDCPIFSDAKINKDGTIDGTISVTCFYDKKGRPPHSKCEHPDLKAERRGLFIYFP